MTEVKLWIFRVAESYVAALGSVSVLGLFTMPRFGLGIFLRMGGNDC